VKPYSTTATTRQAAQNKKAARNIEVARLTIKDILDQIKKQPKALNNIVGRIIKESKGKYDSKRVFDAVKKEVNRRS